MHSGGYPLKPWVLVFLPTGVAAININAARIHSGLRINCKDQFYPLNGKQKASLRSNLSEVRVIS